MLSIGGSKMYNPLIKQVSAINPARSLLQTASSIARVVPSLSIDSKRWYSPLNYRDEPKRRNIRRILNKSSPHYAQQQQQQQQPIYEFESEPAFQSQLPNRSGDVVSPSDPLANLLNEPTLVIERQIEYMNLFLGFEQGNKYVVMDSTGRQIAWLLERDFGIVKAISKQIFRTHRPFIVDLIDLEGKVLLTIKRPFSLINSHIKAILPHIQNGDDKEGLIIGESIQSWHPWRRRYNLFNSLGTSTTESGDGQTTSEPEFVQFGKIDAGFLQWEFPVLNEKEQIAGSVSRNFVGLFREFMTDTGVYIVRMDPRSFEGLGEYYQNVAPQGMSLDEKAIMLANAVSIDFDYFSRKSGGGGLFSFGGGEDI